uniref:Uncharacterized protein n=1 Tax=Glossina morsitans morsitans TaxID=37546 RepID=A0A1B0FC01_GLOMM
MKAQFFRFMHLPLAKRSSSIATSSAVKSPLCNTTIWGFSSSRSGLYSFESDFDAKSSNF